MVNDQSRLRSVVINTAYGVIGQILLHLFNFVYRTVFIYILGANYLGINGLFGNILSMLSLAEFGVGAAITFSLYKPLAENDNLKVKALMDFYAKTYKAIGIIVAVLGISIAPFLEYLIKDTPEVDNLTLIYFLFLADSVVSYFFAYKRSIIIADQKSYINTINQNSFLLIRCLLQMLVLITTENFILTLVIQIICSLAANITISLKVNRLYPYLRQKSVEKLDAVSRADLLKKIRAMIYHQVGYVVVLGTDNLLISIYIGVYWVGLYSNYVMIIGIVSSLIKQFSEAIVASIGNMTALDQVDKAYRIFNVLFLVNNWIYSFCAICLFTLLNPFITLWISEKYLLEPVVVATIVFNFYIAGMRQNVLAFRNSLGLFWYDRYKPLFEAIINLVASILLLNSYGLIGVFLGTLISTVTTSLWVEPYILFKHYFGKNVIIYFAKYSMRLISTLVLAIAMHILSIYAFNGTWYSFTLLLLICVIGVNVVLYVLFHKSPEFQYLLSIISKYELLHKISLQFGFGNKIER